MSDSHGGTLIPRDLVKFIRSLSVRWQEAAELAQLLRRSLRYHVGAACAMIKVVLLVVGISTSFCFFWLRLLMS
jgi:hypothetical protein